jgi:phage terminase large subunit
MTQLNIQTPPWALPLLEPKRYKGAHGGRGSGKSHFFGELAIEKMIMDPDTSIVCIREIQRSLKFSAKKLLENKIRKLGVMHLFDITQIEIRRKEGTGIIIFQGMQDHTADSIKSLEDFDVAWVEEAQGLSARSLKLLRPTIRNPNSELWFSWNPDLPEDPVDSLLRGPNALPPSEATVVEVNFGDNPFLPDTLYNEMLGDRKRDPDGFNHVWEGGYNTRSESQIFNGKWVVDEFKPKASWGRPYFGADWGFSQDPTVLMKSWVYENTLYIEDEAWGIGVDIEDTPALFDEITGSRKYMIRADCSRPETINHVKNKGFQIKGTAKWKGNVEDGITYIRSFDKIVIHPRCKHMLDEARLYSYKICKRTQDILPDIIDKNNHCWDAMRYALDPLVRAKKEYNVRVL